MVRSRIAPLLRAMTLSVALPVIAHAGAPSPGVSLADQLVALSGTSTVLASSHIQAALQSPQSLLASDGGRLDPAKEQALLRSAGFAVWTSRPRLWIVQLSADHHVTPLGSDPELLTEAAYRQLPVSNSAATDADGEVLAALLTKADNAAVQALLHAHAADALVLVSVSASNGYDWQMLQANGRQYAGRIPSSAPWPALLPHVVCERLAQAQSWPELDGRSMAQVQGIKGWGNLAAAQKALTQAGLTNVQAIRTDGDSAWFAYSGVLSAQAMADTGLRVVTGAVPAGSLVGQAEALVSQSSVWLLSPVSSASSGLVPAK